MKKIIYILCILTLSSFTLESCNTQKSAAKKKTKTAAKRYNHKAKDCGCH